MVVVSITRWLIDAIEVEILANDDLQCESEWIFPELMQFFEFFLLRMSTNIELVTNWKENLGFSTSEM